MSFWPVVKKVIKDSDIVLMIRDIRFPFISRNKEVERYVRFYRKRLVNVFTKIDLVRDDFVKEVKENFPNSYFVSGTKNIDVGVLKKGIFSIAKELGIDEPFVGVVGYPNTGKSTLINTIAGKRKAQVSTYAGTTKNIQWIKVDGLRILDSPGVIPMGDRELELGLMGAKNPEKLKNPEKVVFAILERLVRNEPEKLEKRYSIKIGEKEVYEIFEEIARKKGFLVKGGNIDENRTRIQILKDWQKGKISG